MSPIFDIEPAIQDGSRALPTTQKLFVGGRRELAVSNPVECHWYGTNLDPRTPAFGYVKEGTDLEVLVGEFVKISFGPRRVTIYCLGATPEIESPIALTRRAFMQLELLTAEPILVYTEVLD